MDKTKQTGD